MRGALLLALGLLALQGCKDAAGADTLARKLTGGEPARGRELIASYGCGTCHTVPGVEQATGTVGPPLAGVAGRSYLAGRLPNTPENMTLWVRHPQEVEPGSAMPDVGVTEEDARHIAAYLYTLR